MARLVRTDDDVEEENQRYGFEPTMEDSTLGRMQEATAFLEPLHSILAEALMPGLLEPLQTQAGQSFFQVARTINETQCAVSHATVAT